MVQSAIGIFSRAKPQVLGYASFINPDRLIKLTNQKRLESSRPALRLNQQLNEAALAKAQDMFANDYWSHVSPSGTEPWFFITKAGFEYQHAGENLARDFSNPEAIINAWIASSAHQKNILDSRFTDTGIAVMDGHLKGIETTIVVQLFGTPLNENQKVSGAISDRIISQVHAQEGTIKGSSLSPAIPPFYLSRIVSLSFAILLITALALDWLFLWRKRLVRLSAKTWAHLTFFIVIITIVIIIKQGIIL